MMGALHSTEKEPNVSEISAKSFQKIRKLLKTNHSTENRKILRGKIKWN